MELKLYDEMLLESSKNKHLFALTSADFKHEILGVIVGVWNCGGRVIYYNPYGSYQAITK